MSEHGPGWDADFIPAPFEEIADEVRRHLASLPSAIDSFLEEHILDANHYRIVVGDEVAGFAAIHQERLIAQFALREPYRRYGQPLFAQLRRLEQVQSAFVPTCDEFFLAHALDDYRQIARQAYFFTTGPPPLSLTRPRRPGHPLGGEPGNERLRPATTADVEIIQRYSGDFFAPIEDAIAAGKLFVVRRGDEPVGFGLMEKSALYDDVASVGMYTIERYRRDGVGTATISLLIAECRRRGLRPVAGCWYYNHASKRTLERAGMHAPTRLLKIDY